MNTKTWDVSAGFIKQIDHLLLCISFSDLAENIGWAAGWLDGSWSLSKNHKTTLNYLTIYSWNYKLFMILVKKINDHCLKVTKGHLIT